MFLGLIRACAAGWWMNQFCMQGLRSDVWMSRGKTKWTQNLESGHFVGSALGDAVIISIIFSVLRGLHQQAPKPAKAWSYMKPSLPLRMCQPWKMQHRKMVRQLFPEPWGQGICAIQSYTCIYMYIHVHVYFIYIYIYIYIKGFSVKASLLPLQARAFTKCHDSTKTGWLNTSVTIWVHINQNIPEHTNKSNICIHVCRLSFCATACEAIPNLPSEEAWMRMARIMSRARTAERMMNRLGREPGWLYPELTGYMIKEYKII